MALPATTHQPSPTATVTATATATVQVWSRDLPFPVGPVMMILAISMLDTLIGSVLVGNGYLCLLLGTCRNLR